MRKIIQKYYLHTKYMGWHWLKHQRLSHWDTLWWSLRPTLFFLQIIKDCQNLWIGQVTQLVIFGIIKAHFHWFLIIRLFINRFYLQPNWSFNLLNRDLNQILKHPVWDNSNWVNKPPKFLPELNLTFNSIVNHNLLLFIILNVHTPPLRTSISR